MIEGHLAIIRALIAEKALLERQQILSMRGHIWVLPTFPRDGSRYARDAFILSPWDCRGFGTSIFIIADAGMTDVRRDEPEETIELFYRNRTIRLRLTSVYSGALKGVFLDDEYALADVLPTPPRRILDLGANIGMAATALAAQFPKSEFLLVEPDPRNVIRLRRTVEWNDLPGAILSCAVGPKSEYLLLRTGNNPTCSALQTSKMHELPHTVEVAVRTVDEILHEFGWDNVDLVKVDIEGTEESLLTAEQCLAGARRCSGYGNSSQLQSHCDRKRDFSIWL